MKTCSALSQVLLQSFKDFYGEIGMQYHSVLDCGYNIPYYLLEAIYLVQYQSNERFLYNLKNVDE